MHDGRHIDDEDLAAFVSGEVPTAQAVATRIGQATWNFDNGPGIRALDWITARADRAMEWLEQRTDLDERVDVEDVRALRDMLASDADGAAVWMHQAGARAGGEEAARQHREHRAAGRHHADLVAPPPWPEPPVHQYPAGDPRSQTRAPSVCMTPGCPEAVYDHDCWCYLHLAACHEGVDCRHPAHECEAPVHHCTRHWETP